MNGESAERVTLATIMREWGRIGVTGFGGPPAHISLLRRLCVSDRAWMTAEDFEDSVAAMNMLPGPASTQLAIYCAWRLRGPAGAVVGGLSFIVPGLVGILALSVLFLAANPPLWVRGAAAGAGAAVPAVAVKAGWGLIPPSWERAGDATAARTRWLAYFAAGALSAVFVGPYLVAVLLACGALEATVRRGERSGARASPTLLPPLLATGAATGGLGALAFVAFKVGALSFGGGFVIIPLMAHDAVVTYHWMSSQQFLNAVALGQVTPGPVTLTVAVVGYSADRLAGGVFAAFVAFLPSFVFVIAGATHFERLRSSPAVKTFFNGAGAAAIGAIVGSAVPLGRSLEHLWQLGLLAVAVAWLFALRRGVVWAIVLCAGLGVVSVLLGAPAGR
jgi:chromate transporter